MLIASKPTVKLLQKRNLLFIKNMGNLLRISIGVIYKAPLSDEMPHPLFFLLSGAHQIDGLLLFFKATRLLLLLTSDV